MRTVRSDGSELENPALTSASRELSVQACGPKGSLKKPGQRYLSQECPQNLPSWHIRSWCQVLGTPAGAGKETCRDGWCLTFALSAARSQRTQLEELQKVAEEAMMVRSLRTSFPHSRNLLYQVSHLMTNWLPGQPPAAKGSADIGGRVPEVHASRSLSRSYFRKVADGGKGSRVSMVLLSLMRSNERCGLLLRYLGERAGASKDRRSAHTAASEY